MPIRLRLTLIFTSLLAVVIAAAGLVLVLRLRSDLKSTIDTSLRSRAGVITGSLEQTGSGALGASILIERDEAFAEVIGSSGVDERSPGLTSTPLLSKAVLDGLNRPTFFEREVTIGKEHLPSRLLAVRLADGRVLVVGSSLEDQQEAVRILGGLLILGGPLLVGLAGVVVWSVTGAALRPVERLRQEADAVSISEAGRTLTVPETNDEIARLGASMNDLLSRTAEALDQERRFIDEAGHELRTPLATLKADLELAVLSSNTNEEMRSALERALADADYLSLLTEDLLVLARANGGRLPIRRSDVDVAELVGQVVGGFDSRANSQGNTIDVDVEGSHSVDPLRLRQVLNNLLDNALRHGGPGGTVLVKARLDESTLVLEVEDTGLGFSDKVLASPLDPRARPGLHERSDRDGLGLPIVKAIAEAHGGSIEVGNAAHGGARVRVRFPSTG